MLAGIIAIFGVFLIIIKFIKDILVRYVGHAIILTAQFAFTASTILFVVAFYAFAITTLIKIFNLGIEIFTYSTTSTNGAVSCLFGFLNCVGFAPALQNGFIIVYASLSSVVIFHLMKFTYHAMKIIGNELFKLGVLLGQALK